MKDLLELMDLTKKIEALPSSPERDRALQSSNKTLADLAGLLIHSHRGLGDSMRKGTLHLKAMPYQVPKPSAEGYGHTFTLLVEDEVSFELVYRYKDAKERRLSGCLGNLELSIEKDEEGFLYISGSIPDAEDDLFRFSYCEGWIRLNYDQVPSYTEINHEMLGLLHRLLKLGESIDRHSGGMTAKDIERKMKRAFPEMQLVPPAGLEPALLAGT